MTEFERIQKEYDAKLDVLYQIAEVIAYWQDKEHEMEVEQYGKA